MSDIFRMGKKNRFRRKKKLKFTMKNSVYLTQIDLSREMQIFPMHSNHMKVECLLNELMSSFLQRNQLAKLK